MATVANETDDLQRLASAVRSREYFESIFDDVRRSNGATGSLSFKALAVLDMNRPRQPFLKALTYAQTNNFLDALVDRLMQAEVFDYDVLAAENSRQMTITPQLQALTRPELGMQNVALEMSNKNLAARRLCSIRILNATCTEVSALGTGFLVGPQLVLTSGHLLEGLLDVEGKLKAGSSERIVIAFDHANAQTAGTIVPVLEDEWLAGYSKPHPVELGQQAPDWDNMPAAGFDNALDFSLIRLARAVGYERGFYALDPHRIPVVGQAGAMVSLFQHPAGRSLHSSYGAATRLCPANVNSRVLHNANSLPGSSGGLLVDNEFKPVGLHQCSYVNAQNHPVFNGAIATASIAGVALALPEVLGLDPIWRLSSNEEAVIGRDEFQQSIMDALSGDVRILSVAGSPGMGRSFSTRILREIVGVAEHLVVELPASKLPTSARATAQLLLDSVAAHAHVPMLPDTTEAESSHAAWIAQELLPAFSRALADIAGTRTVWLAIDDIDTFPIANTSTRLFLESLYAGIGGLPALRILLIGFQGAVPGAPRKFVRSEVLRELSIPEIAQYIDRESLRLQIPRQDPQAALNMAKNIHEDAQVPQVGTRQRELARLAARAARRP